MGVSKPDRAPQIVNWCTTVTIRRPKSVCASWAVLDNLLNTISHRGAPFLHLPALMPA